MDCTKMVLRSVVFLSLAILFVANLGISQGVRCFLDFCVPMAFSNCYDRCESHGGCRTVDLIDSYCYAPGLCTTDWYIECEDGSSGYYQCFDYHPLCNIEPREPGPPPGPTAF